MSFAPGRWAGRAFRCVRFVRTCVEVAVGKTSFGRSVVAAALIASGCGGGSPTSNPPVTVPSSTPTPASTGTPTPDAHRDQHAFHHRRRLSARQGHRRHACNRTARLVPRRGGRGHRPARGRAARALRHARPGRAPRVQGQEHRRLLQGRRSRTCARRASARTSTWWSCRSRTRNDFNDQYDIMISQGYVRRGAGLLPLDLLPGRVPARPRGRDRPGARRLLRASAAWTNRSRRATARARSPSTASAT